MRVLDAGADKPLAFLNDAHEENPALGLRGIRALRASEDILREQLTALAEADAATDADLWVMAPMVATVEETEYFVDDRARLRHQDRRRHGRGALVGAAGRPRARRSPTSPRSARTTSRSTRSPPTGCSARSPSFQDPWHPAVLRLIREVGDAGRIHGKPVGICGEAAADPLLAVVLVGLGATSLSMAPTALADVRASLLAVHPRRCPTSSPRQPWPRTTRPPPEMPRVRPRPPDSRDTRPHSTEEGDTAMTTASTPTAGGSKARVGVQRFGTFLSGMIMPNIPALIAWGIFTPSSSSVGWTPNADLATIVGPFIHYLLPIIIAYTGGNIVYGIRGGVVASIAVMGAIAGSRPPGRARSTRRSREGAVAARTGAHVHRRDDHGAARGVHR